MPQTFAITVLTHQRRSLFTRTANAELFQNLLFRHRHENRYQLHAWAIMPDHAHVLITPSGEHPLPRCIQSIKGGLSHAIREQFKGDVWHPGHHEHRIRDASDFENQKQYIARNPERKFLEDHPWVHTHWPEQVDPIPPHLSNRGTYSL